ncbi:MAG: hypothetical protein ACK5KQ_06745 [Anaerorhabdus sp.]
MSKTKMINHVEQDEIATFQIRSILINAYDFNILDNVLSFKLGSDNKELVFKNNHIYLTPGTQLFYLDVENAYFEIIDGGIWINFLRNNQWVKRILIYE